MAKNQQLSIREQAAVKLYISGFEKSPQRLYQIAHRGSLEDVLGLADLAATASRWFHSKKVQDYLSGEQSAFDALKGKERMKIESETIARIQTKEGKEAVKSKFTDYSNAESQVQKLNEIVNTAKDPSEALDALKVLIARKAELQPEEDATRPGRKQVHLYRPLRCFECPLYREKNNPLK